MTILNHVNNLLKWFSRLEPQNLVFLKDHEGKILQLIMTDVNADFFLAVQNQNFVLLKEGEPTLTLTGTTIDFGFAFLSSPGPEVLMKHQIQVKGDTAFLQALMMCFKTLPFDPEATLSKVVGENIATQVSRLTQSSFQQAKQFWSDRSQDTADYFQSTKPLLPTREAFDAFKSRVQLLNNQVEKLSIDIRQFQFNAKKGS